VVPSTWLSVLLFFLFIAPGLLFDLLSEQRRAGVSESAFREISRIVLSSLAFSGLAFAVLGVVRWVRPAWMPDPQLLLDSKDPYAKEHYLLILRTLTLQVLFALTGASVWHIILARIQGEPFWQKVLAKIQSGATIRQVSAWTQVFKRDCPKGHDAYVRVRLEGGIIYFGLVANFSSDLDVDGRELILAKPIMSKTGDNQLAAMPGQYQRVVIRGSAIEVMSVEYRPKRQ
jgi:Family of unknown function (DUF6338)